MKTATIHQTKTHLSRLLKEVQAGETVVILNGSTPVARLTALDRPVTRRPRVGTRTSPPVRYANDAAITTKVGRAYSRRVPTHSAPTTLGGYRE